MLKQVFIVVRHRGFHNNGCYEVNTPVGNIHISHYDVVDSSESLEEAEQRLDEILSMNNKPMIESMPDGAKYHTGSADEYMIIPTYIKSDVDLDVFCSNLMN